MRKELLLRLDADLRGPWEESKLEGVDLVDLTHFDKHELDRVRIALGHGHVISEPKRVARLDIRCLRCPLVTCRRSEGFTRCSRDLREPVSTALRRASRSSSALRTRLTRRGVKGRVGEVAARQR